jgi:hypothetical protein
MNLGAVVMQSGWDLGARSGTSVDVKALCGAVEGTPPLSETCLAREPNHALHLTAYRVRSCLAPASGSR